MEVGLLLIFFGFKRKAGGGEVGGRPTAQNCSFLPPLRPVCCRAAHWSFSDSEVCRGGGKKKNFDTGWDIFFRG